MVSIIMPVYNAEKYICETIQAVLAQRYTDIELIIVNDGSTDNSVDLILKCLKGAKIHYEVVNQENRGLASARNTGCHVSHGEYICFIDSDDIISPDHILGLITLIDANKIEMAFSDFEVTKQSRREGTVSLSTGKEILSAKFVREKFQTRKIKIHACALMLKRTLLERLVGPFGDGMRYGEDADFIWRCLYEVDKIGYNHQATYKYLVHENSLMTTFDKEKIERFFSRFWTTIECLIDTYPEDSELLKNAYNRIVFAQLRSVAKITSRELFIKVCKEINFEPSVKELKNFPDIRVRVLSYLYQKSPKVFWKIHNLK